MKKPGVIVGYSGVHQAYQLALAAQGRGILQAFYCSFEAGNGKWGSLLQRLLGRKALLSRRLSEIHADKIKENPWPLLLHTLLAHLGWRDPSDWLITNDQFDRWMARSIRVHGAKVVVATETCAQHSLQAAQEVGAVRLLDCPQFHPRFLLKRLQCAAEKLGFRLPVNPDAEAMSKRKDEEFSLAEIFLVYSDLHETSYHAEGFAERRFFKCPLWVDSSFWSPTPEEKKPPGGPLRLLFVGGGTLRKGLPFLLQSLVPLMGKLQLTIVGSIAPELESSLAKVKEMVVLHKVMGKEDLRETYRDHDLFVLPSVADSFGFVALEAMACGLPAIVTDGCGVPVPEESWRVPAMDVDALTSRLTHYCEHEEQVIVDGTRAAQFALDYSPSTYREKMGQLFEELMTT